jgi:hypothetical protein
MAPAPVPKLPPRNNRREVVSGPWLMTRPIGTDLRSGCASNHGLQVPRRSLRRVGEASFRSYTRAVSSRPRRADGKPLKVGRVILLAQSLEAGSVAGILSQVIR